MNDDPDLPFEELVDVVIEIEAAIGRRGAGCTPFGSKVIAFCEDYLRKIEEANNAV